MKGAVASQTRELLINAADYLKGQGVSQHRLESEVLLAYCLGVGRVDLYRYPEKVVPLEAEKKFWGYLRKRGTGYPLAYITGSREFYGLDFVVNPQVLIPRPETELMVDTVRQWLQEKRWETAPLKGVDLGTGSGVLAVTLAWLYPCHRWWAVDISPAALEVARINAARQGVEERLELVEGDYWEPLLQETNREKDGTGLKFSLVVANPPYVTTEELQALSSTVKDYEPLSALHGGENGLQGYRRILAGLE